MQSRILLLFFILGCFFLLSESAGMWNDTLPNRYKCYRRISKGGDNIEALNDTSDQRIKNICKTGCRKELVYLKYDNKRRLQHHNSCKEWRRGDNWWGETGDQQPTNSCVIIRNDRHGILTSVVRCTCDWDFCNNDPDLIVRAKALWDTLA